MKVRISDDAVALACGADAVAEAFVIAGADVERVSSWGMHWLEPLVDIDGVGYGSVTPDQVATIMAGNAPSVGRIEAHPFIAKQTRLTFARAGKTRPTSLDDYYATGGWLGLAKAMQSALRQPSELSWRQVCADAAVLAFLPGLNGKRSPVPPPIKNISCATPTKATAQPLPTGW